MTVVEVVQRLKAETIVAGDAGGTVSAVYAGDFLSRVMGKAPAGSVWLTVMGNVNVAGVAVLADVRIVVLCEGVRPDPMLIQKCESEGIALAVTDEGVYECCKLL